VLSVEALSVNNSLMIYFLLLTFSSRKHLISNVVIRVLACYCSYCYKVIVMQTRVGARKRFNPITELANFNLNHKLNDIDIYDDSLNSSKFV